MAIKDQTTLTTELTQEAMELLDGTQITQSLSTKCVKILYAF